MRLPKLFEGGTLTLRRTSPVSTPAEPENGAACGAHRDKDGRGQGADVLEKNGGRCVAAGGTMKGTGTGKNKDTPTNGRSQSKLSLLWKVYGPGSSETLPTASAGGAKVDTEAGESGSGKKESKYFRGFGRKFSMRSAGGSKKGIPVRRSNTLPGKGASCNGNDSSLQQKYSVLLAEEKKLDHPPDACKESKTDVQSGNKTASAARTIEVRCAATTGQARANVPAHHDGRGRAGHVATATHDVIHTRRNLTEKKNDKSVSQAGSVTSSDAQTSHRTSVASKQERSDSDLSRGSSESTLRHEGSRLPFHYLSTSEVTSCDLPLVDLTSSDTTPAVSPYSSITSSVTRGLSQAQHGAGTLPFPTTPTTSRSHSQPPVRNLDFLSYFLASFRVAPNTTPQETYENVTSDTLSQSPNLVLPCDPAWDGSQSSRLSSVTTTSSVTASESGHGSSASMSREVGSQGHMCPRCQVNFLTSHQLLEHWSVFHTHDALQLNLSPLYRLNPYGDEEDGDMKRKERKRERDVEEEAEWTQKTLSPSSLDPLNSQVTGKGPELVDDTNIHKRFYSSPEAHHSGFDGHTHTINAIGVFDSSFLKYPDIAAMSCNTFSWPSATGSPATPSYIASLYLSSPLDHMHQHALCPGSLFYINDTDNGLLHKISKLADDVDDVKLGNKFASYRRVTHNVCLVTHNVCLVTHDVCLVTHDVCLVTHDVCLLTHDVCLLTHDVCLVTHNVCLVTHDVCLLTHDVCLVTLKHTRWTFPWERPQSSRISEHYRAKKSWSN
ncbi:uncharacterized protein [Panulirus ornatus]|uniref:uncharacterized protein n=1 Tax=Panulirus ornatus TaxID=150431 RepID=UPI003A891D81